MQNDRGWRALMADVLGAPEFVDDPRFATNPDRVAHRRECDDVVATYTAKWTTAELTDRLNTAGVPAAQINDVADVVAHPQLAERDRWRRVGTEAGPIDALLPPMIFGDVELAMGDVPALGEHTDAILAEFGLNRMHSMEKEGSE